MNERKMFTILMRHSVDECIAEDENIQLFIENQNLIMYNNNYLTVLIFSSLSIPRTWTTLSSHGCSFGKPMFGDKAGVNVCH